MNIVKTLEAENDYLKFYIYENLAIIRFKDFMFEKFADLVISEQIIALLDWIEIDPVIHAVLFFNTPDAYSSTAFARFAEQTQFFGSATELLTQAESEKKVARARQMNSFRNYIKKLADYKKICIFCFSGTIVSPAIASSLVADLRYAAHDSSFAFEHAKHDLHPSGALPYLLPLFAGQSKANELLFECPNLNAKEALNVGLLNDVIFDTNFEEKCIEKAKSIAQMEPGVARLTKLFLKTNLHELERYFDFEEKILGY